MSTSCNSRSNNGHNRPPSSHSILCWDEEQGNSREDQTITEVAKPQPEFWWRHIFLPQSPTQIHTKILDMAMVPVQVLVMRSAIDMKINFYRLATHNESRGRLRMLTLSE